MKCRAHGVILLVIALLVFSYYVVRGWDWSGPRPKATPEFFWQVVRIIDGDTIEAMRDGQSERVRLNGIDCPEKGQGFATAAKQFISNLVFGQNVTVHSSGQDRYGRTIGDVFCPTAGASIKNWSKPEWPGDTDNTPTIRPWKALNQRLDHRNVA